MALCALYGVESGIGGWETTSLRAGGAGPAAAASWTAGYWAAIAGRLLAIPLALRVPAPALAAGSLLLAAAGLGLAHLPALAPFAYTLTGLALGPVFPDALAWLAQAAPGPGATATVFAAANLGGVVLPVVIGRLVDASSAAVIPTTVLVVSMACLGTTLLLRRVAAPAVDGAGAAAQDRRSGHGPVDVDQGFLLVVGEDRVGADGRLDRGPGGDLALLGGALQQAGLDEQGLGGHVEGVGDRLEDPDRRLVEAPLELAQVGVGDLGHLGQLPQRQVGQLALGPDEGAEGLHLRLPGVVHGARSVALDKPSVCKL